MDFSIVDKCITLIAKRKSGKSYLLRWLVKQHQTFYDKIFCICPTEKINKFYQNDNFIDPKCIYESYDESFVKQLIDKMTKSVEKGEKRKILLILDDCVADTRFHDSPTLKQLFVRGRHLNISVIITSQYMKSIPPIARSNSDFILLGQLNQQGLEICSDEFTSAGLTKKEFAKLYRESTMDFNFLIINNDSTKYGTINETYGTLKTPASEFPK